MDLDAEIAAEDHRQGREYGVPGHCGPCRDEVRRRLQEQCPHDGSETLTGLTLAGTVVLSMRLCTTCGKQLNGNEETQ
jgi:hypothetical protein